MPVVLYFLSLFGAYKPYKKTLSISNSALKSQSYSNESLQGKTALEGELILVSGFQGITEN